MTRFGCQKVLIIFFALFANNFFAEVKDPILDFFSSGLRKEDSLIVFYADLNEDGIDEVFISTDSETRSNSKAGIIWDLYISGKNGFVKAESVDGNAVVFFSLKI